MPAYDRTGPMSMGPGTGGGRGLCGPNVKAAAGWGGGFCRRGFGGGRAGRGRPWGWGAPLSPGDQAQLLQNEAEALRSRLGALESRLAELENEPKT